MHHTNEEVNLTELMKNEHSQNANMLYILNSNSHSKSIVSPSDKFVKFGNSDSATEV